MKKLLIGAMLAALPFTAVGSSFWDTTRDVQCMPDETLVAVLVDYEEEIFLRDIGTNTDDRFSIWINPKTRSWTAVTTDARTKTHCIVAFGRHIQFIGEWE